MTRVSDMQAVAEARLGSLMQEGTGTVVGVSRISGREKVFIALNDHLDEADPSYHAKIEIIRARLKAALKDIPFGILGHYDDPSVDDVRNPAPTQQEASVQPRSPEPMTCIDDRGRRDRLQNLSLESESERDSGSMASLPQRSEFDERLMRLERRTVGLPSKGFIVAATLLNLSLVALMLVYQTRLLSFINEAVPGMRDKLQSLIGVQ